MEDQRGKKNGARQRAVSAPAGPKRYPGRGIARTEARKRPGGAAEGC